MGFAATEAQRIASMVPDKGQGKTYNVGRNKAKREERAAAQSLRQGNRDD